MRLSTHTNRCRCFLFEVFWLLALPSGQKNLNS
jgi:hypothetical protein